MTELEEFTGTEEELVARIIEESYKLKKFFDAEGGVSDKSIMKLLNDWNLPRNWKIKIHTLIDAILTLTFDEESNEETEEWKHYIG